MATPINKLQKQAPSISEESSGNELIDSVLKQVGNEEECGSSASQCPMPNKDECSVNSSDTRSSDNEQLIKSAMKSANGASRDIVSSVEASEQADKMIDQMLGANRGKRSFSERLLDELREPVLVIILFVVFNTGFFSNLLSKYLSKYVGTAPQLNYLGMATHAILFGSVYYILKKLLA